MLSIVQVQKALAPYGIEAAPEMAEAVARYVALLIKWNQRISLTSVREPLEIVKFHFGESLLALQFVNFTTGRLADIGSGAGFPGLAIKLAAPALEVHLIESNQKKSTFLSEVIRTLGISSAFVERGRYEDLRFPEGLFDLIACRALGHFENLLLWSSRNLKRNGKVVLWVGSDSIAEILSKDSWRWRERIAIPMTSRRFVLIGERRS